MTTIALVTRFAVAVLLLVVAVAVLGVDVVDVLLLVIAVTVLGVDVGDGGNSRHRHSVDSIVVVILSIQGVDCWRTRRQLGKLRRHLRSLILENERREDHFETEQGDGQDDDDVNRGLGLSCNQNSRSLCYGFGVVDFSR